MNKTITPVKLEKLKIKLTHTQLHTDPEPVPIHHTIPGSVHDKA